MRILNFFLIISICFSFAEMQESNEVRLSDPALITTSPKSKLTQKNDKLTGTWYAKEVLISGKPDPENYPVNNDELTLNRDMTMITIDRTFNMEDRGIWERISDSQFAIITEDEKIIFQILLLTNTALETKMISEDIDMVIKFKRTK